MKLIKLDITGMTCAVCAGRIEKAVMAAGAERIDISVTGNYAKVVFDEGILDSDKIINAIEKAGYGASLSGTGNSEASKGAFPTRIVLGSLITLCIMYLSMGHMIGLPLPDFIAHTRGLSALIQMILALGAALIFWKYFTVGFGNLIKLSPTMDSLIALGSAASFIYSAVLTALLLIGKAESSDTHLYFESSAMILTLVSVGKTLEEGAKRKTRGALASLLSMTPETARVVRDGVELEIPVSELEVGDIAIVRGGDRVPADGVITEGEGIVDESSLTGESYGVEKEVGSAVSDSTVCLGGYFKFRVERSGRDTAFGKILDLVEDASASKAPIARLADKVASVFVPTVMGISLLTFIAWVIGTYFSAGAVDLDLALRCSISVLVISCPCALGLATPTAVTCAVGRGAALGIFIKDAASIESAGNIDTVVFDKTGTLTEGNLKLIRTRTFGIAADSALYLAASIEQGSAHPVAEAILRAYEEQTVAGIPLEAPSAFSELPGRGASAVIGGREYTCGGYRAMKELGAQIPEGYDDGYMKAYLAREKEIIAEFSFFDMPKKESADAVKQLKKMKKRVIMLTGDNSFSAENTARLIGIESSDVISGVLPDGKGEVVKELTQKGCKVAMVGDGVNDAPSLTLADLGIAMGAGRDAAIECADIVLMRSDVSDVPRALALFSKAYAIIKQNLFWALIYNVICIPIAAGALYPLGILLSPMIGSGAMSLSSLFVVTNALRLMRFNYKPNNKKDKKEN